MRIAFYAPMKAPDHPAPSGDRRVAGLLVQALGLAGHEVALASRMRSWDGTGDPDLQHRLDARGARAAERFLRCCRALPNQAGPDLWFTYHLYYKAADWIGPAVARALRIPYVVAEASVAAKRAEGAWAPGHRATLAALDLAALVIALNPADIPALPHAERIRALPPFLDAAPYAAARAAGDQHRTRLAQAQGLDPALLWIGVVAMMRPGDKLESYRILARALAQLNDRPWQLLVAGDGPARSSVEQAFAPLGLDRIRWLGELSDEELPGLYAACDLAAWPAVNEAYGMALLEAQATALPVVAGRSGGVPEVVEDGKSGILCPPGCAGSFARGLASLLTDHEGRAAMGRAALSRIAARHSLTAAARRLDGYLNEAVATP